MQDSVEIILGHEQSVDVVKVRGPSGDSELKLTFKNTQRPSNPMPPLSELGVEVTRLDGEVVSLDLQEVSDAATLLARGKVEGAYRARVNVLHDDHVHEREENIVGAQPPSVKRGGAGGSLVRLGGSNTAEIIVENVGCLRILFTDDGPAVAAPDSDAFFVESIKAHSGDGQVAALRTMKGSTDNELICTGEIEGAVFVRLTLLEGDDKIVRSVPL